jgi:hypothetical protein
VNFRDYLLACMAIARNSNNAAEGCEAIIASAYGFRGGIESVV